MLKTSQKIKNLIQKAVLSLTVFCFLFSIIFLSFSINLAIAAAEINTSDLKAQKSIEAADIKEGARDAEKSWWDILTEHIKPTLGTKALKGVLRNALKKIAYDTATYIGSGGRGQQPLFITEGWNEYLGNIADEAAGEFLEGVSEAIDFDLCDPDLSLKINIGLGLKTSSRPGPPRCAFTQMTQNWEEAIQRPDFLDNTRGMFEESDFHAVLKIHTKNNQNQQIKAANAALERLVSGEWLRNKGPDDKAKDVPGDAEQQRDSIVDMYEKFCGADSGREKGILEDVAATFVCQLMYSLLMNLLSTLGEEVKKITSPGDFSGNFDYEASPRRGGASDVQESLRVLTQPDFSIRGDYDILVELSTCPDPTKAGPTNCVIDDNFRQAISDRKTVGQAMDEGYLNPLGVFGFISGGLEPKYNEAYPYRSMIILRKFRILPVGWEVAAERLKDDPELGTRNLGDLVACFDSSDDYAGYYQDWCSGLVDPSWVLKAPLNFCKREGPGPEILSEQIVGSGSNSSRQLSRNDNYCADEQSCVKEYDDGSCELYGYCTEERRTWGFDAQNCEALYNTCETFNAQDGKSASYLKNTLDYCDASEVGCREYSTLCNYEVEGDICEWDDAEDKLFFNRNVEACGAESEGCRRFIRTKSGLGVNLLKENLGLGENFISAGPQGYLVGGQTFSLSFLARNCEEGDSFEIKGQLESSSLPPGGDWQFYSTTFTYPEDIFTSSVIIDIDSAACEIQNAKLERGQTPTVYSAYGEIGEIHEKLLPSYLAATCYSSPGIDYSYKEDAAPVCDNFARQCNISEAGCELYTSRNTDLSLPAQVSSWDYCQAECAGYDTYIQSETNFSPIQAEYFIPRTANICSLSQAGCEEFTNLDELARGGEEREYYTYLRQCIKPSDPESDCRTFYTWEQLGSGPQIVNYTLQADADGNPAMTNDDADCADIYNLPPHDPAFNPDCREYYNEEGAISYVIQTKTITCSQNCHTYRQKEVNLDSEDNPICFNGSLWSEAQGACLYKAIPGEGIACAPQEAGCREYIGNTGANIRVLINHDFEDSTGQGWLAASGDTIENTQVAIARDGRSLRVANEAYLEIAGLVREGKSYTLSFIIRPDAGDSEEAGELEAYIANGNATSTFSLVNSLLDEWQYREINLARLDYEENLNERLYLSSLEPFYIDNIKLTEITDRHYLIRNSWETPNSCDQDIDGNPSPGFALGCDEYYDRDNQTYYLHSFNTLCQESAIGCEMMINTQNSLAQEDDEFMFAVYDRDKACFSGDKGCERLGLTKETLEGFDYTDKYLKNDPDKYDQIVCAENAVGCEAWITGNDGQFYFKDPGEKICQWRQLPASGNWGWFKNNDEACEINDFKTIGLGGLGGEARQPDEDNFAGLCPTSSSGCAEYIDPISKPNINEVFNYNFSQDLDENEEPDGWANNTQDNIYLEPNTLYRFDFQGGSGQAILECEEAARLYYLDSSNNLAPQANRIIELNSGESALILDKSDAFVNCAIRLDNLSGVVSLKEVAIAYKIADDIDKTSCNGIVDFEDGCVLFNERAQNGASVARLNINANTEDWACDPESEMCDANSLIKVNPNRVCDKWLSCRSMAEIKQDDGSSELVCVDVGLCDRFDDNGNCINFVVTDKENQIKSALGDKIANLSGYSKVGYDSSTSFESDYYPFSSMDEAGEIAFVPNGGFEFGGENNYPIGWIYEGGSGIIEVDQAGSADAELVWDEGIFRIIDNPIETQLEGIRHNPEGKSFLKLGSIYNATSEYIDVEQNTDYILTAYINTLNLQSGIAKIEVQEFSSAGDLLARSNKISNPLGEDWTFRLAQFKTGENVNRLKIKLFAQASSEEDLITGNFYFDNIRLSPALNSRDDWHTPQICRLYPEKDSLSCDYLEDSGNRQKGILGYCLEYDRYPGSSDACLLWWPVDRVKGDGIDEGVGYRGKFPLYYCMEAAPYCESEDPNDEEAPVMPGLYCSKIVQTVSMSGQNKYWSGRVYEGTDYIIPFADDDPEGEAFIYWGASDPIGIENITLNYIRDDAPFGSVAPPFPAHNPYEWDGRINTSENFDNQPLELVRLQEGTKGVRAGAPYYGEGITCNSGLLNPFPNNIQGGRCGSARLKGKWDNCFIAASRNAGCSVSDQGDGSWIASGCAGNPHVAGSCRPRCQNILEYNVAETPEEAKEGVRRLFAQSYGAWEWEGDENDGRYIKNDGEDWTAPNILCPDNIRPDYPDDLCAIAPTISNIKVNQEQGSGAYISLRGTSFLNLTFNSNVDEQQLPLVMYAVDWGDYEQSIISGVEMRDRLNEETPHSFYHLYSYWDLKSKSIKDQNEYDADNNIIGEDKNTVYCGEANSANPQNNTGATINISPERPNEDYCIVKPSVKVKDNWGWCNGGASINDCDQWDDFSGWVLVEER